MVENGRPEVNMTRYPRLVAILFALAAAACRSVGPAPAAPGPSPTSVPAAAAVPARAEVRIPEAIRWVRDSAEHRAVFLEVYRQATARVEEEAPSLAPGTWAVVLDADETVLDNSAYEVERVERRLPFDAKSWHAWTARREAPALPGAAAFLEKVRSLGGKIAIVTNRAESECPDTEADFRDHGLAYDVMLCKPAGVDDKNPRFEALAKGTTGAGLPPLHIVAFLGDNILDFPGLSQAIATQGDDPFAPFGVRYFILPNPMYGSWH
jgi:5'-nucleotidase (lipoprotein e(P4) family)